ncbi:hypothetical protein A2627_02340 [Candidatus Woesebacteria bacterium RIFCSPHIGHO2_01_FULL_39_28]|uniref:Glycosyltransferase 2-like domain-containing protein n=1 Tax=Candidatus Woesebacteria bacterium RIFCSPHIGHO2_01_FULL_39_28 TaxID=1802496 RepID=A0A1F7YF85_9BACT|nr:MAG: hypothetical protein A2627_02340 [Candidatus Woesebacteria bacterium RIFCSPHIGHO2_01_FULL_39_28]OGM58175.1 MAG: hypothetical protein A3A50_00220 [Candidatus Woesebacteria bacterium RIFCSPLOWO2_01_FULL_38_20]
MKKSRGLTIGIPAFNEEANIGKLLKYLLAQRSSGFEIKEIIVSSDASVDRTVSVIKSFQDRRIIVIDNKGERQGIARGLNQIILKANGDILVTLDADIRIEDNEFLLKLIRPILQGKADLTSSAIKELVPNTRFAKILNISMVLKDVLFKVFKNGDNVYTCHGLARAYSSKFYRGLNFPVSIGNDMYCYLACISKGYLYKYVSESVVWYKLPENFSDHQNQSLRFFVTQKEMEKIFGNEFVKLQTNISPAVYFKAVLLSLPVLVKNPLDSIVYFFVQLFLRLRPKPDSARKQAWNIVASSKKI